MRGKFAQCNSSSSDVRWLRVAFVFVALTLCFAPPVRGQPNLTTLWSFGSYPGDAMSPVAGVIADQSRNLYGTTEYGGDFNDGTVFKYGNGTLQILASFNGTNGNGPYGDLTMDSAGNLFGTTQSGGQYNDGSVFKISANSNSITTIASFDGDNGKRPLGKLLLNSAGDIYGTTQTGGLGDGFIFKIKAGTNAITTLADVGDYGATAPRAGLIADRSGSVYGTTEGGGALGGSGTVFKYSETTNKYTQLAAFNSGPEGGNPDGALVADVSGNLYGTTHGGGLNRAGTLFKLNPSTGTLTTLYSFGLNGSGNAPFSTLIIDAAGNLFGTTSKGGAYGDYGTVFKYSTATGTLTTLWSFNGSDGQSPFAGLLADAGGNLFGTTVESGPGISNGTIFEVTGGGYIVPEPTGLFLPLAAYPLLRRKRRRSTTDRNTRSLSDWGGLKGRRKPKKGSSLIATLIDVKPSE